MSAPIVETADLPCPPGAEVAWLGRPDGARLRTMVWSAAHATEPHRGTIVLASGRTEFIEKYFEVITMFLARGFAVATFDWRGQGLSTRMLEDPRKGHIDDFATFDADFAAFMEEVVRPHFKGPYIGVGHSMGGNLMLRAAYNLPTCFAGIVLSAPMMGLNLGSPFVEKITRWLTTALSSFGRGGAFAPGSGPASSDEETFEQNIVTSDPERYARQQVVVASVPSIGLGGPTVGWVQEAFKAIDEINDPAYLAKIKTPVLLFEAGADKLVRVGSVKQVADGLPRSAYVLVEGAAHEILMERDPYQKIFWDAFDRFSIAVLDTADEVSSVDA